MTWKTATVVLAVTIAAAYSALAALPIERVSVSSAESSGNSVSDLPAISGDGRFVAFRSEASNLVPGDTNSVYEIFVRDVTAGTTERVCLSSSEVQSNSASTNPDISDDGNIVVFESNATNLIDGSPLNAGLIYARNRAAGTTELISQSSGFNPANGFTYSPAISGNGRFVAFISDAANLGAPSSTGFHVYVRDRQLGTTERVSIATDGTLANAACANPCVSFDGRYVAYSTASTNLIPGGTDPGIQHVYLRDRTNNTTELVDVDNAGVEAPGHGFDPAINADGSIVAFTSNANGVGTEPFNDTGEKIYVRNRSTNLTELVTPDEGTNCSISGDGRYVAFLSDSAGHIAGDTNGFPDVFVRDRFGVTARICVSGTFLPGNNLSDNAVMSADGNHVAFESSSNNLTPNDGNGFRDVFVRDLEAELLPLAPSGLTVSTSPSSPSNRLILNWVDGSTNERNFEIQRSTGDTWSSVALVGPNVTTYTNLGLNPDTLYFYRVRALNGAGGSEFTGVDANATYPLFPAAPNGLSLDIFSKTRIDLNWADNADNEDGFKIERKIGAGAFVQIATLGANAVHYAATGLTPGTQYSFRVRAYNAPGGSQNSAYSNTAVGTTIPNPPAAPSGLTAIAPTSNLVNLTWTDNSTNETLFLIERKVGAGNFVQIATRTTNQTSYADTNRNPNTNYTYRVRATNAGGNGSYSNSAVVDTLGSPSGLSLTPVSQTRIDLSWTDNSAGETGFKIERRQGAGAFSQIATVGANITTFTNNTGLVAGTNYTYRVRAYKTNSDSSFSNSPSASTLP